ncbi:MAG: carboxypeptidase regulatory-like domain-containing protein, partial [Acidobacteria bacterium]
MKQQAMRLVLALSLIFGLSAAAFAQGGATSSISGVVVDATGGVVPGATVTVKNEATNATFEVVSGSNGAFTVPSLTVGSYTVSVQLQGFKTFVAKEVRVTAGAPTSIKATLEVGGLEQTVTVEAAAAMVQTTGSSVAKTIDLKQISNLPLASRNAIDF